MKLRLCGGVGLVLLLVAAGMASGQDCGCGSAAEGGHRHFWPGPYGGANCGREYNHSQAEALWAGYCTENCSLCGRGCGGACGNCGTGAGGPFAGFSHAPGSCGPAGGSRFGHHGSHGGNLFSRHGHGADCGAPCEMGGKAGGRSLSGCSQWGWGDCGQGCNCEKCGSGANRAGCEHLRHVGRAGRYFQPVSCAGGCDEGSGALIPPHASSVPTNFHRYHSGASSLPADNGQLPQALGLEPDSANSGS